MICLYQDYYSKFYLEMVRMSNANLNTYIRDFIEMVTGLAKTRRPPDVIRAAIGVTALHDFGYDNFDELAVIFDRLLPQTELEHVKFTSWCAGHITHHPKLQQSQYASRLFHRLIGWTRSVGKRNRNLAAAYMINSLSFSCGMVAVMFIPALKSIIWSLLSDGSMQVLEETTNAVDQFTVAVIRYSRSVLNDYLKFYSKLCKKLASFGEPIRRYTGLLLLKKLINSSPSYYSAYYDKFYSIINQCTKDQHLYVEIMGYSVMASLTQVDPKMFDQEEKMDKFFERTHQLITEFPNETSEYLCLLIRTISSRLKEKSDHLKECVKSLINHPDCAFPLLTQIFKSFGESELPKYQEMLVSLIQSPITEAYKDFFVTFCQMFPESLTKENKSSLSNRLKNELNASNPLIALKILAEIPSDSLINHSEILKALNSLKEFSSIDTREYVPKAIFNIAKHCPEITRDYIFEEMFHFVLYDHAPKVRSAALRVLYENADESLATAEYMKLFQIFANDDAITVRSYSFKILEKLIKYNSIMVSSITRNALLDSFFILRHVPSIRQRSRTAKILPDLFRASAKTIKVYSSGFMDIAISVFQERESQCMIFENFLEEAAYDTFFIGIVDAVSLLAPLDPDQVSKHSDYLIIFLCYCLENESNRSLILSVLHLLYVLLTAPASSLSYRAKSPLVLSVVSKLLATTDSHNEKIECLRVIGAIGVLEVHQKPTPVSSASPPNIEDSIARQFYHPSRDIEMIIDDSLLISNVPSNEQYDDQRTNQYYKQYNTSLVASSVFEIFNDDSLREFHFESAQALVTIFQKPLSFMLGYFDLFVDKLLGVLQTSSDFEIKKYLPLYAQLIKNSDQNITPFVKQTLNLITSRFSQDLAHGFLVIIVALLECLKDAFSPYASDTICLLIDILDNSKTTDAVLCREALNAFAIVGIYAADLLYLIVPQICDAIVCEQTLPKVRISALHALTALARSVDLFPYLGPIMRAMSYGIFYPDPKTSNSTFEFLYTILMSQGSSFLKSIEPIVQSLRGREMETPKLKTIIDDIKSGKYNTSFKPLQKEKAIKLLNRYKFEDKDSHVFSEDAIIYKGMAPNLGREKNLEQWLRSFMLAVISNSPSPEIRSCTTLATSHFPLASKLFNAAFFSCWIKLSELGKSQITRTFEDLLKASDTYNTVNHEIIKLLVFMDKIERPLNISSEVLLNASTHYGGNAFVLHLISRDIENTPDDINKISSIIDLYTKLGCWPDAVGMWKKSKIKSSSLNSVEVLSKLKMWDQVEKIYKQNFESEHEFVFFTGMIQALANLAKWKYLYKFYATFTSLNVHRKEKVAPYFAAAAMRLGHWDVLSKVLEFAPRDNLSCICLAALNALHEKQYDKVDDYVNQGFILIASSSIAFLADNQQIQHDTMVTCQELVEISEIKQWVLNENRNKIQEIWNERLKTVPRDFKLWFDIIANRASFTEANDQSRVNDQHEVNDQNIIKFFLMKSATLEAKKHTFKYIFPKFKWDEASNLKKVCYIISLWNKGKKNEAVSKMSEITRQLDKGNLLAECQLIYSNWVLENTDSDDGLRSAFHHLKSAFEVVDSEGNNADQNSSIWSHRRLSRKHSRTYSNTSQKLRRATLELTNGLVLPVQIFKELTSDTIRIDVLRKWADVNVALIARDPCNNKEYAMNAINALAQCAKLSPSFPDIVLLLNLFFEGKFNSDSDFFNEACSCIESLQPKLLLQASPQILVQLGNDNESVAKFIHGVVYKLLDQHYHELIFSVIVLTKSKTSKRSTAAQSILKEFRNAHPDIYNEVFLIRKCMLRAAVTWPEMMLNHIQDAFERFRQGKYQKMREPLEVICEMSLKERAKCPMHRQFQSDYGEEIHKLRLILDNFNDNDQKCISEVSAWCKATQDKLSEELKQIHTIQMSAISKELCEKTHFMLAVFGTYKPQRNIIRIQYFVGQFSVLMSKQQPKDVIIKGEDGNFYQYLLKGHEDLRLDERIMQFFRLINSLLMKETSFNSNFIQTICVIPLSVSHGLVQWVPGTETLKNIVEEYRRIHDIEPMIEYELANKICVVSFDQMKPIQKMQVIESIFHEVPDTDIANAFWLKAPSAEDWLKRTNTFAISVGITSIVGYIIGLGDRHPSNLLIDRNTGKAIHIDFGDSFEKAMLRKFLPEVVPFRLTRMMIKAFGPSGYDGLFRSSFVKMSGLLRENSKVLKDVLAVFVAEPLIDQEELQPNAELLQCSAASGIQIEKIMIPNEKSNDKTNQEITNRVAQKLSGKDFGESTPLSVEEQATKLIQMATDTYNLSRMYSGWCPFW